MSFYIPRQFRDGDSVVVFDNDIEKGVRTLRIQIGRSGIFTLLKRRVEGVSVQGRRRVKRSKARARLNNKLKKDGRK